MAKQLFFVVVSCLVVHSAMLYAGGAEQFDLTGQANAEISPDEMMHAMFDLAAYKNIVCASKDAIECEVYKKSLKHFSASFNNLVQVYTRELASKLNAEEKAVINDVLTSVKDFANLIKLEVPRISDPSIDQATRDQRAADFNSKFIEQCQQMALKMMPFGLVVQEQKIDPKELDKNFNIVLSQVVSFLDSLTETFHK